MQSNEHSYLRELFASGARKDWLHRRVTVAEAEAANTDQGEALDSAPVPFGYINDRWCALVSVMQDGDELWEFRSPPETWQHLSGRSGYVMVRRGDVVGGIITVMS